MIDPHNDSKVELRQSLADSVKENYFPVVDQAAPENEQNQNTQGSQGNMTNQSTKEEQKVPDQKPDDGHLDSNDVDDSMFIFPSKEQQKSTNVSPTRQPSPGEEKNQGKFIF